MRDLLRAQCPSPDRLAELFDHRIPESEAPGLYRHVETCELCAAEWSMMSDFATAEPMADERADVDAIVAGLKRSRRSATSEPSLWRRLFALPLLPKLAGTLAAVAIVAAIGIEIYSNRTTDFGNFKESGTIRSGSSIQVSPRGDISAVPREFTWTPVAGTAHYEVRVSEVDGTELWGARTTVPRADATESVRGAMLPRKTLIVTVTAIDEQGRRVAQSDSVRIRLITNQ